MIVSHTTYRSSKSAASLQRLAQGAFGFGPFAFGAIVPTTLDVTRSWRSNTSSRTPSKWSAHKWPPVDTSMSLATDTQATCRLANAAFQHVADAKLPASLPRRRPPSLVGKRRIARDNEQRLEARQAGDDVLDQAIDEVLLLRIARSCSGTAARRSRACREAPAPPRSQHSREPHDGHGTCQSAASHSTRKARMGRSIFLRASSPNAWRLL